MQLNKNNIDSLFYIFITAHLVLWTLVPSLTNNNLPLDTIEALAWGSNLDWGFNKHPPASAFFLEVFYQIFGAQDWAYYLLSQIFVVIAFVVVFKFKIKSRVFVKIPLTSSNLSLTYYMIGKLGIAFDSLPAMEIDSQ